MSSQLTEAEIQQANSEEAECPSCGGSFAFNPATSNLKCPYCEFESEIPDPQSEEDRIVQELDFTDALNLQGFDWGAQKKSVICKSCGAEAIYDALQVADVCAYCDSNQLMEASADNALSPNGVVPFVITINQAAEQFTSWLKRRWFTPRAAKEKSTPESFKGIYLPHWTFDSKTATRYQAQYGKDRTVTKADGKSETVTDWSSTQGLYQETIDDHLVLASSNHEEALLGKIRPFHTGESKPYDAKYLAGYVAERYSIGIEAGWKKAQDEIQSHLNTQIQTHIKRKHKADRVRSLQLSVAHSNVTYKYLMLPIWLSSFKYNGKLYHFAVNGQSGKVGGSAPISALRVGIAIAAGLTIISGIIWFFNQA